MSWIVGLGLSALVVVIAYLGWRMTRAEATATARAEVAVLQARLAESTQTAETLKTLLGPLAQQALADNRTAFLADAAREFAHANARVDSTLQHRDDALVATMAPIAESFAAYDTRMQAFTQEHRTALEGLREHVEILRTTSEDVRHETAHLTNALRATGTRGQWGEMQLRRVVELAGMVEHCDFTVQPTLATEGGVQRPDLLIHLPADATVVVDAKAPLTAFLASLEMTDEGARQAALQRHAGDLRTHIAALSRKAYWSQFPRTPDFVVLFLPSEAMFRAALEVDVTLLDAAATAQIVLATPMTLIALLRTVAVSWRHERLAANAEQVALLGAELYERMAIVGGHMADTSKHLERAVVSFNKTSTSIETRFLVSLRRMNALGIGAETPLPAIPEVTVAPTHAVAPELAVVAPEA